MFENFVKIDNSTISGLIFAFIFSSLAAIFSIYILFFGGAEKQSTALREYHLRLRLPTKNTSFLYSPIVFKIMAIIFPILGTFAVYCATQDF